MTEEEWTCGKGLAKNAELPAAMTRVVEALTAVLEHHRTSLKLEELNARMESAAYAAVIARVSAAGTALERLATEMESHSDLAVAEHDLTVVSSPKARYVFVELVNQEKHLLALLENRQREHRAMLAGFG